MKIQHESNVLSPSTAMSIGSVLNRDTACSKPAIPEINYRSVHDLQITNNNISYISWPF
jgi:hypothetical protein